MRKFILPSWLLLAALAMPAFAQSQPSSSSSSSEDEGRTTRSNTDLGYIDSAVPRDQIYLRYDSGYGFDFANRAEFFYARSQPGGPGLPRQERSIDYQDLSAYAELKVADCASVFVEAPFRWLNPAINDNHAGFGDVNGGFKVAWLLDDVVATFQLRAFAPTGAASRGLGTRHASIEPALLVFARLDERIGVAGELRYWVPLGGTDFAGEVLRYGVGVRYDLFQETPVRVSPIVELVGWSVLSGRASRVTEAGVVDLRGASGTILNLKVGARFGLGEQVDLYAGYGRALTGERWYEDLARVELRFRY